MTKPSTPHAENGRVIRASEVGAYLYCAHAWWLGPVKGRHPDNNQPLQAGWTTHERHGRQVGLDLQVCKPRFLSHFP